MAEGEGQQRGIKADPQRSLLASPRFRLLPTVLAGVYCWALTVVPVALAEGGSGPASLFTALAIFSLVGSIALPPGRFALLAALDGFVLSSGLAWWFSRQLSVSLPFPLFGSLGWLCFTLAVGVLSMPATHEEGVVSRRDLAPRVPPSRLATGALLAALLGAVGLLLFAWEVKRPGVSTLAHALALAAALLLLRGGASLAVYFQQARTPIRSHLSLRGALAPVLCFVAIAACGAAWVLTSG